MKQIVQGLEISSLVVAGQAQTANTLNVTPIFKEYLHLRIN